MEIDGADRLEGDLRDAGFVPGSDFKGTFFYGGIEVEFLTGTAGAHEGIVENLPWTFGQSVWRSPCFGDAWTSVEPVSLETSGFRSVPAAR